jgi:hypothetical protein
MIKTCLLIMFFCFTASVVANAEEQAVPASPVETPAPEAEPGSLSVAQIQTRADEVNAELLSLFAALQEAGPDSGELPAQIDALADDLERVLRPVNRGQISALRQSDAETLLQTLNRMNHTLSGWHDALAQRIDFLDERKQLVRQEIDYLQGLLDPTTTEDLPVSLVEWLETLHGQIEAARVAIRDRLDLALAELSKISAMNNTKRKVSASRNRPWRFFENVE